MLLGLENKGIGAKNSQPPRARSTLHHAPEEAWSAGSPTHSLMGEPTFLSSLPLLTFLFLAGERVALSVPLFLSQDPSPVSSTSGGLFLTCLHTSSLNLVFLFLFSFKSCPVTSGNSLLFFVLFLEPK